MKLSFCYKALVLLVVISLPLALLTGCSKLKYAPHVIQTDIVIENYSPSVSNTRKQDVETPHMAYSNGKLFLYYWNSPYWNELSPWREAVARRFYDYESYFRTLVYIENGKITTIANDVRALLGSYEDWVYFCGDRTQGKNYLCAYNTQTNTVKEIVKLDKRPSSYRFNYDITPEGVLLVESGNDEIGVYHIKECQFLGCFQTELPSFTVWLGENIYTIDRNRIYCNDDEITDEFAFSENFTKQFHPMGDGVVVEAEYGYKCQFVFYLKSNGEIIPLLPEIECDDSKHDICVYGDYVFISFQRLTTKSFLNAPTTYKDDDISGTYRIDVRDFSRTKISDQYFKSMFIFDDTGIFVDNRGTYKIDFDGNTLLTIVE